ncbi:GTP-binding protein HSR1-related protein [Thalassoporum mexicanum PCC 7367]|uniref:DUF697 domain-containing protein n=1 Tax=Thalassoporum mexicanum TaxID=3457544 RepID=UPI00029FAF78|nr:DUF697 domain-containing protein [Pseudanabaena sp. PCC 7367]AFY68778.1 GTP-binding protein HSR1-related protein [Pseudanabaena sp. PCC 7367]
MANSRIWLRVGLVVGIGTAGMLGMLTVQNAIASLIDGWPLILLGAVSAVGIIFLVNSRQAAFAEPEAELPLDRDRLKQELQKAEQLITKISDPTSRNDLNQRAKQIATQLTQEKFRITVFGTGSSGKTSVINALMGREVGNTAATIGTTTTEQEYPYAAIALRKAHSTQGEKLPHQADSHRGITSTTAIANPAASNQSNQANKKPNSTQKKRQILLIDTPGLQEIGTDGQTHEAEAVKLAQAADLLIFVADGDLTNAEHQQLQQLCQLDKRVILAFNKTDRYMPTDRVKILAKLKTRVAELLKPEDIVAIAACPAPIKVRQYHAEANGQAVPTESVNAAFNVGEPDYLGYVGSLRQSTTSASQVSPTSESKVTNVTEWLEPLPIEIAPLRDRIEQILSVEQEQLLCKNARLQIITLKKATRLVLRKLRRTEAEKIITRYQWLSAATVFANPLPGLDLVAGAAINTQLIIELGRLYEQKFSANKAKKTATIMAELLIKLGGVEVITTAIATFLKANAITYAIGGSIQAITVAYLTRIGGISFLDYLEQLDRNPSNIQPKQTEPMLKALHRYCQSNLRRMQGEVFFTNFIKVAVATLAGSNKTAGNNSNS